MRTHRHIGSVAALIVMTLTGSLFVAAPASAGTAGVAIDLLPSLTSKKAIYHDGGKGPYLGNAARIAVGGRVTSGGTAVASKPVALQRLPRGSQTWTTVGTGYTNGAGDVQVVVDAAGPAAYRLFFDGSTDATYASAYSPEHTVKIMRDLNAEYLEKGSRLIFKGKVAPAWKKKKIVLERKTSKKGKWKVVKTSSTDKRSKWSFRLGAPRTGSWYYRAWVPKKQGFVKSYSHISVETWTY